MVKMDGMSISPGCAYVEIFVLDDWGLRSVDGVVEVGVYVFAYVL